MNILGIFIMQPFLALLPAVIFALLYTRCRQLIALVASLAWLAYLPYELAMKMRILCSGECNIRVDLLLFYPALAIISFMAFKAFMNANQSSTKEE